MSETMVSKHGSNQLLPDLSLENKYHRCWPLRLPVTFTWLYSFLSSILRQSIMNWAFHLEHYSECTEQTGENKLNRTAAGWTEEWNIKYLWRNMSKLLRKQKTFKKREATIMFMKAISSFFGFSFVRIIIFSGNLRLMTFFGLLIGMVSGPGEHLFGWALWSYHDYSLWLQVLTHV